MSSDPFADPFADDEPAPPSPPSSPTKRLQNFGETAATEALPDFEGAAPPLPKKKLQHLGETQATESLPDFGGKVKKLQHFGETSPITLEHMGETGAHTLEHMGETGALADPFADEAPARAQPVFEETRSEERPLFEETRSEPQPLFDETRSEEAGGLLDTLDLARAAGEEPSSPGEPEPDSPFGDLGEAAGTTDQATMDLSPAEIAEGFSQEGSEALTLNEDRDAVQGEATADLRAVSEPPPLDAEEAERREREAAGGDEAGDPNATATLPTTEDEDETQPDFLYGERFSDRFEIPEGPPPRPSRLPQVLAGAGGLVIVVALAFFAWKLTSGPREFQGREVPPQAAAPGSAAAATGGTSGAASIPGPAGTPIPLPPKPGEGASETAKLPAAVVEPRKPPEDAPPPLPPTVDPIDLKLRRAVAWGLPIEPVKPGAAAARPAGGEGGER